MSIDLNNKVNDDNDNVNVGHRVKILSPAALVVKRFVRNRLAITGSIFIGLMFLFSFVGGWLMPYDEAEIFTKYEDRSKIFAGISQNEEYKYIIKEGFEFPLIARSQFVLAVNNEKETFSSSGVSYIKEQIDDELFIIYGLHDVALITNFGGDQNISVSDKELGRDFKGLIEKALNEGKDSFVYEDEDYKLLVGKKATNVVREQEFALVTMNIFDYADAGSMSIFEFCYKVEMAIDELDSSDKVTFIYDDKEFEIMYQDDIIKIFVIDNGKSVEYADVSDYLVQPLYDDVHMSLDFKAKVRAYIKEGAIEFDYPDEDGEDIHYMIYRDNIQWTIERQEVTLLVDKFDSPSAKHLLGTDGNGMDLITRLMYGGRVSLMIGLIVVIIETFIGIVLGGIAGYFGKAIDSLIMRIVDIFNCIPSLPLLIILGSMMDSLRVDPWIRMIYLMLILAFLGWPSIARMVRGQILSLREQEFMTATEATGLDVSKRIFKHLIPNIIPQLIVICTLSLGGVIMVESTLSFLGIGVKFPFASWGNIINAVSNVHVMTNYLFVWIPAGMLILITVLGFNFIGDGLRDAFDPKMKR